MEENKKNVTKKSASNATKTTKAKKTSANSKKTVSAKKATTSNATKTTNTKKTTASTSKTKTSKKATPKKVDSKVEMKKNTKIAIKDEKDIKETITKEEIKPETKISTSSSELKRLYIICGFIGILLLIGILSAIISIKTSAKIISKIETLKSSETEQIIYIVRTGCSYCELNEANMISLKKQYNIDYYEVNTAKLTKKDISKMIAILNLDASDFGTPTLSIVKNNEVLNTISGVSTYDNLFYVMKNNNLIDQDAKLYLNYINYNGYKSLLNTNEPEVLILASSTCHFCLEERPILDEIAQETGAKINWIYLDRAFSSEEEYNDFMTSTTWIKENSNFGTPTTIVIQNGEVTKVLSGYREKEDVITFYKQNGIIK